MADVVCRNPWRVVHLPRIDINLYTRVSTYCDYEINVPWKRVILRVNGVFYEVIFFCLRSGGEQMATALNYGGDLMGNSF